MLTPVLMFAAVGAAIVYALVMGTVVPARVAVLAVIVLWIYFPNWGTNYIGIAGEPPYFYLELAGTVALIIALAARPRAEQRPLDGGQRLIIGLFGASFLATYTLGPALGAAGFLPGTQYPTGAAVGNFFRGLNQLVFLYAVFRFIRGMEEVDRVIHIICWAGAYLTLEWFLLGVLRIVPPLSAIAIHEHGAYNSLILNDFIAVSLVSGMAVLAAMYLADRRKQPRFYFVAVIVAEPMMSNGVRSVLIGVLAAIVAAAWWRRRLRLVLPIGAAAAGAILLMSQIRSNRPTTSGIASGAQSAFSEPGSLFTRIGLQLRTLEVIRARMPVGTGEQMLRYYMASPAIPASLSLASNRVAQRDYLRVLLGEKVTVAHNLFLEAAAEYGLLGIAGMVTVGLLLLRHFRRSREALATGTAPAAQLQLVSYQMLVMLGVFYLFNTLPKLWMFYFFFIHASFLLRAQHDVSQQAGGSRA